MQDDSGRNAMRRAIWRPAGTACTLSLSGLLCWLPWKLSGLSPAARCVGLLVALPIVALVFAWIAIRLSARPDRRIMLRGVAGGCSTLFMLMILAMLRVRLAPHLPGWCDFDWNATGWVTGFREEGCKLLAFVLFFQRGPMRKTAPAQKLLGMAVIALVFAVNETPSHVPPRADADLFVVACASAFQMLFGAPVHVCLSLSCACLALLAERRRVWLAGLPLVALLHSTLDVGFVGLSRSTTAYCSAGITAIVVLCAVGLLFVAGRVLPNRLAAGSLALVTLMLCGSILALQTGLFGPSLTFQPFASAVALCTAWVIMAADLLIRAFRCRRTSIDMLYRCE